MGYPDPVHKSCSRRGLFRTYGIASVFCLAFFGASQILALPNASSSPLTVHSGDGKVMQYRAYPEATVRMLFPSSDAWLEGEQDPDTWRLAQAPILKKIRLLTVSDMKHRFTVTVAVLGEQLFIFDELFCSENSAVMNELIRAAHSTPRDDAEAMALAKLYLSLSYYQLDDPAKFLALRGSNHVRKADSETPNSFSDLVGVSHSPRVSYKDGVYSVDLFTYAKLGATGGPTTHWRFDLADSRFDEKMAAQLGRSQTARPQDSTQKDRDRKRINFAPELAGNARGDDGAEIDLQVWSASDGPGISRNHYYYQSHQLAEARMQDFLGNAVAVLDSSPWGNAAGETPGKEALILQVNKDWKSLFASQLYEDERSVLELSCSCLRNLMAAEGNSLPRTQH